MNAEMRCLRHFSDLSSAVGGVCASCLRDKLLVISEAQEAERRRTRPIVFPRSVSPFRKESVTAVRRGLADRFVYGSPQLGPNGELISWNEYAEEKQEKKKRSYGFSLFYNLFRSNKSGNRGTNSDPVASNSDDPSDSPIGAGPRTGRISDRGISPATYPNEEEGEHFHDASSGCSTPSSPVQNRTTTTPAAMPHHRGGRRTRFSRSPSGMTSCLNPLVWASPNRGWSRREPDVVYPGETTAAPGNSQSTTSFCKNRSKKLADFGRFRPNR
ncbi:unnamed protein product [Cuscuta campestris]|uniref:Uncharacterized protein n=2 Tax=Cuscuta sect. Cleistogrammica TaxID=1824901 RepID=A0A484MCS4_9ASTE|nr:hypothetical protein DM860_001318 [Cuscuta australis]VFQ85928.1 unnamed protein product [Cuscuta campestris]